MAAINFFSAFIQNIYGIRESLNCNRIHSLKKIFFLIYLPIHFPIFAFSCIFAHANAGSLNRRLFPYFIVISPPNRIMWCTEFDYQSSCIHLLFFCFPFQNKFNHQIIHSAILFACFPQFKKILKWAARNYNVQICRTTVVQHWAIGK